MVRRVTSTAAPSNATDLRVAVERLRNSARNTLRSRAVDDILAVLDRVIGSWLEPGYPLRRIAERDLPAVTGFSVEMIRYGLPRLLAPWRADSLRALLDAELGGRAVLDGVHGGRRAYGPELMAHVLAGNIPGMVIGPVCLSLAIKAAVLVKPAAGDPLFPTLFARSISDVDAELGRCILVAQWHRGDRAIEEIVFSSADLVVASGSDAAIAAIAARVPGRFIGHGHRISFAAIARESLSGATAARELARRLAYDVCLWDQQGCLSPQLCYLESGAVVSAADFAQMLAAALAACELPPRALTLEEKAAVLRSRQDAEWRAGCQLIASPGSSDWTVTLEPDATFLPSCLNRFIRLKVIADLSQLPPVLHPHRQVLEAAGLAAPAARYEQLAELLAACGARRICTLGTMQEPPLAWRQSGRPRVADWVEWAGVESTG
jgi:hypothetical protein